jgi:Protein of unknown function (DUF3253)
MSGSPDSSYSNPVAIGQEITRQTAGLAPGKSICPSDVARVLAGSHPDAWSKAMPHIRRVAVEMAKAGKLLILRKGKVVDPADFRGVYRLGAPRQD